MNEAGYVVGGRPKLRSNQSIAPSLKERDRDKELEQSLVLAPAERLRVRRKGPDLGPIAIERRDAGALRSLVDSVEVPVDDQLGSLLLSQRCSQGFSTGVRARVVEASPKVRGER
jgi:hypothetical protein